MPTFDLLQIAVGTVKTQSLRVLYDLIFFCSAQWVDKTRSHLLHACLITREMTKLEQLYSVPEISQNYY